MKERERPVADRATEARGGERGSSEEAAKKAPICTVAFCPVCTAVTALGDARPDIVEHLLLAARETLLALQGLIEVRLDGSDAVERPGRVERITID